MVTMMAAFSARSAMTWKSSSAATSASGTYPSSSNAVQLDPRPACQHAAQRLLPLCFYGWLTSAAAVMKRTRLRCRQAAIARPVSRWLFPVPGFTDQRRRFGTRQIASFGLSADARSRDMRRLREVELLQRLEDARQEPVVERSSIERRSRSSTSAPSSASRYRRWEWFCWRAYFGQRGELRADGGQMQPLAELYYDTRVFPGSWLHLDR